MADYPTTAHDTLEPPPAPPPPAYTAGPPPPPIDRRPSPPPPPFMLPSINRLDRSDATALAASSPVTGNLAVRGGGGGGHLDSLLNELSLGEKRVLRNVRIKYRSLDTLQNLQIFCFKFRLQVEHSKLDTRF